MMHSAEVAGAMTKSIDFHLSMEALWDGQSYNFKPHVPQVHDRLHFEEGCTNFMHANELDETHRLVISFSVRDYKMGDSSVPTTCFLSASSVRLVFCSRTQNFLEHLDVSSNRLKHCFLYSIL